MLGSSEDQQGAVGGWSKTFVKWWSAGTAVFLLLPLFAALLMSFSPGDLLAFPPSGFSLRWYEAVLTDSSWVGAAVNSLIVAVIAVLVGAPCGAGLAVAAWRMPRRWRQLITSLSLGPAIMPLIVMAIALFFTLAKLRLVGTRAGLGICHAVLVLPLVFIAVSAALEYFDEHLIDAAESLGASRQYAFRTVLVPFIAPAIAVGGLLAFTASLDEAVVAIFIGGGRAVTIPNLMWRSLTLELSPAIAAVSTMVAVLGLLLQLAAVLYFVKQLRRRRQQHSLEVARAPISVTSQPRS
jgi:putative spermidine/putrescine transport system permease protein